MSNLLQQIKIVLVETSHSGNIGSAARAMKTMGLSNLCLVAPQQAIDAQAIALSAGAEDILQQATLFSTLSEALADCSLVIGASARLRHLAQTLIEPKSCAEKVMQHAKNSEKNGEKCGKIAIIFGRERIGLTNEELLKCHYHLYIPANPDYASLNLAMAVQLVCYELRQAYLSENTEKKTVNAIDKTYPTFAELEHFFTHTEHLYRQLGFVQNQAVMQKLRRLYQRAALEKNELNILQGMLTAVEKALRDKGE